MIKFGSPIFIANLLYFVKLNQLKEKPKQINGQHIKFVLPIERFNDVNAKQIFNQSLSFSTRKNSMEGNVTFEVDLLNLLVNFNGMHNPCQI